MPKINTAYTLTVALVSQADTKLLQANPTLATGDVKVSIDDGSFANITTLPTVTPASGVKVKVPLSASEMNGSRIDVLFKDAAGAEWCDQLISIETSPDDLTLANIAAAISREGIKKNTALNNFPFVMLDSTDHVTPITGRTVTATRSIDGGTFAACANAVVEIANGAYKINFATTDLNGDMIVFRFTAAGADPVMFTVKTAP